MFRNFLHNFLARILVIVLLVSAVGIAEVSHLCKLSMSGGEETSCAGLTGNEHPCCENLPATGSECCSNEVKIYQGSITLILKESLALSQFFISSENHHSLLESAGNVFSQTLHIVTLQFPPRGDGQSIVVSNRSFLI